MSRGKLIDDDLTTTYATDGYGHAHQLLVQKSDFDVE